MRRRDGLRERAAVVPMPCADHGVYDTRNMSSGGACGVGCASGDVAGYAVPTLLYDAHGGTAVYSRRLRVGFEE